MCTYFYTNTDVAQNLIDDFFSNFDCQRTFPLEGFYVKKIGSTGSIAEKMEVLNAEFNERAEPVVTSNYSVTLFCIFCKYTVKNNYSVIILYSIFILCQWLRIIRPSSQDVWFMNFPSQIFYNNIDHGYRAAILKEIFL